MLRDIPIPLGERPRLGFSPALLDIPARDLLLRDPPDLTPVLPPSPQPLPELHREAKRKRIPKKAGKDGGRSRLLLALRAGHREALPELVPSTWSPRMCQRGSASLRAPSELPLFQNSCQKRRQISLPAPSRILPEPWGSRDGAPWVGQEKKGWNSLFFWH